MYIKIEKIKIPKSLFPKLFDGFSSFSIGLMSIMIQIKQSVQASKELDNNPIGLTRVV